MENTKREAWIDLAKGIAIVSVLCQHIGYLCDIKPENFFFAVPLFVILSGYTHYKSDLRMADETWKGNFVRHITKMVRAYIVCAFIYEICDSKSFDFEVFLHNLLYANESKHHYFVFLFIQLMLIDYWMFHIVRGIRDKIVIKEIMLFILLLLFAIFSAKNTNIMGYYGGGGKLFGSVYIVLYYLGMLYAKHCPYAKETPTRWLVCCLGILCFFISLELIATGTITMRLNQWNLPSITSCAMAICIVFVLHGNSMFAKVKYNKPIEPVARGIEFVGQHSLYIYLYHMLIYRKIIFTLLNYVNISSYIVFVISVIVLIIGSIVIERVLKILLAVI